MSHGVRLPVKGRLAEIFDQLDARPDVTEALQEHLLGGTSAEKLSRDLTATGFKVGASTIKQARREWREEGVCK